MDAARPTTGAQLPRRTERWIVGTRIEAFRGIPAILELDFGSKPRPPAVVILGDNGSGKSSIIDALQFALQLRLHGERGKACVALGQCGMSRALPSVTVYLSDGTDVEQKPWYEDDVL